VVGWVQSVADVDAGMVPATVTQAEVEASPVRCPVAAAAAAMEEAIRAARKAGDSLGGTVGLVARGVPPGWGEPVFDKLDALLARAMLSIPAAKGFELGSGFAGTRRRGSEHNDPFLPGEAPGEVALAKNDAGGVLGGISSGAPLALRVAFKPTATIPQVQATVDRQGQPTELQGRGRHDPCVLPRAVPIVEAMACLVLADLFLRHEAQCGRAATGDGPLSGDARLRGELAP
jgi:chorismate synthase